MPLLQSFRATRWIRTINLVLQGILFFTLVCGVNYLAVYYPWRFDLTHLHSHSLSAETRSYLKQLARPVKIYVTIPKPKDSDDSAIAQAYRDVTELLREYVFATEANPTGRVTFECIDVYQRGREAKELDLADPNLTLVRCGEKRHLVGPDELYHIEKGEKKAFLGEQAITAAILDVSNDKKNNIYFLNGHGELDPGNTTPDRGLSTLATALRLRNFEVDRLDLTNRPIPDDATLIISAGQQTRYSAAEEELLRQYLDTSTSTRPGRMMLFIPPALPANGQQEATGLGDLLFDWGIIADDVVVYDMDAASISDTNDLILSSFNDKHPITQPFISNQIKVRFGVSRSVRVNPSRSNDESLTVTRLIGTTSETAWGERNYRTGFVYDRGIDMPSKALGFAVASERVTAKDKSLPYSVQAGRLVVFSCADFITNDRLGNEGNLTLVLSSINWLVGRDAQLNVAARPIEKFQLTLSQRELLRLRYSLLFGLPGAVALLGLIVFWTRRR
jgi:hypothetical protein